MEWYSIMALDTKDLKVLEILKENAKLTTSQISKKINIPITTVHNRIRKLEKQGIIKKFTVELDYKKLDRGLPSYILVTVSYTSSSGKKLVQEEIAKKIKNLDSVEEVAIVAGGTDLIVKVRVKDVDELNNLITKKLRDLEGVETTQTLVVLQEI